MDIEFQVEMTDGSEVTLPPRGINCATPRQSRRWCFTAFPDATRVVSDWADLVTLPPAEQSISAAFLHVNLSRVLHSTVPNTAFVLAPNTTTGVIAPVAPAARHLATSTTYEGRLMVASEDALEGSGAGPVFDLRFRLVKTLAIVRLPRTLVLEATRRLFLSSPQRGGEMTAVPEPLMERFFNHIPWIGPRSISTPIDLSFIPSIARGDAVILNAGFGAIRNGRASVGLQFMKGMPVNAAGLDAPVTPLDARTAALFRRVSAAVAADWTSFQSPSSERPSSPPLGANWAVQLSGTTLAEFFAAQLAARFPRTHSVDVGSAVLPGGVSTRVTRTFGPTDLRAAPEARFIPPTDGRPAELAATLPLRTVGQWTDNAGGRVIEDVELCPRVDIDLDATATLSLSGDQRTLSSTVTLQSRLPVSESIRCAGAVLGRVDVRPGGARIIVLPAVVMSNAFSAFGFDGNLCVLPAAGGSGCALVASPVASMRNTLSGSIATAEIVRGLVEPLFRQFAGQRTAAPSLTIASVTLDSRGLVITGRTPSRPPVQTFPELTIPDAQRRPTMSWAWQPLHPCIPNVVARATTTLDVPAGPNRFLLRFAPIVLPPYSEVEQIGYQLSGTHYRIGTDGDRQFYFDRERGALGVRALSQSVEMVASSQLRLSATIPALDAVPLLTPGPISSAPLRVLLVTDGGLIDATAVPLASSGLTTAVSLTFPFDPFACNSFRRSRDGDPTREALADASRGIGRIDPRVPIDPRGPRELAMRSLGPSFIRTSIPRLHSRFALGVGAALTKRVPAGAIPAPMAPPPRRALPMLV